MRLRYSAKARRQIRAIGDYIAQDNPAAAKRVVARLQGVIRLLAKFPRIGHVGRAAGTKEWVLSDLPYRVVYEIAEDEVTILNVYHTAQDR
jgi:toxin ParE1/3/4